MSYRPPYGSQPPGGFAPPGSGAQQPMRPGGGAPAMQAQYAMGVPPQQGYPMMQQQAQGLPGGAVPPQMFPRQPGPGGIYAQGYGQMPMGMGPAHQPYMGPAGMVQPGMLARGGVGMGPVAPGMVPGMAPGMPLPQNMTPAQQKKFVEQQRKLLEEQKKKEEQERKERDREEQKRKLREFSTAGAGSRGSLGSTRSLDMGDLLSKSLMTPAKGGAGQNQSPGMPYSQVMHGQAPGMMPAHGHPMMMRPQMAGGAVTTQQQPPHPHPHLPPHMGATAPTGGHSQSMDDGFGDFKVAAAPAVGPAAPGGGGGRAAEGDDFGDFLHAPSKPAPPPTSQPVSASPAQPPNQAADDEGFGDFLGGPGPPAVAEQPGGEDPSTPREVEEGEGKQPEPGQTSGEEQAAPTEKKTGMSLENMMMQSTNLSESQKQRKRFNQKPSLNEVKGHTTKTPPKPGSTTATTFATSTKSRSWQQAPTDDLSALFTLPAGAGGSPEGPQQQGALQQAGVEGAAVGVLPGQMVVEGGGGGFAPGMQQPGGTVSFQPSSIPCPGWLQNEAALPTVYHQVLEASSREGAIDTSLLYPIFLLSGLDRPFLGHIWSLVNHTTPGQLVPQELYLALALISQAQRGQEVSVQALFALGEAPVPQLQPQSQPPSQQPPGPGVPPLPGTKEGAAALAAPQGANDDDDFAPFQEAPKSLPSSSSASSIPTLPGILPPLKDKTSKKATSSTLTSLDIPPTSTITSRHSSSPAFTQDHTPTEGDEDESFDDFKSAPTDGGPPEPNMDLSTKPSLPGADHKFSSSVTPGKTAGATNIPILGPPKGKSAGSFATIPPPPHGGSKAGSSAVRAFGSEEQLRTGLTGFGDFGNFKAAEPSALSNVGEKKDDDWGSFGGHQQFKHSASDSNLQGMHSKEADDRYAALRDIGDSLFDSEPIGLDRPNLGGGEIDDEFADFQQAGAIPIIDKAAAGVSLGQGSLFPSDSQLQQPDSSFAAFSPPKEGSDWAEAATKGPEASSPQEEEFEGFFSSRTHEPATRGTPDVLNDSGDKYSSLAGLHSFVTDIEETLEDDSFGDFQTSSSKAHQTSSSKTPVSDPPKRISAVPPSSGITLFRLTPPPMTSSSPSSEDGPGDDRFSALRDLSGVDPFNQGGPNPPDIDDDYYDTQFKALEPVGPAKPTQLDLDDLSGSQSTPHKLELSLDTPAGNAKVFPIGSISQLDLKSYDLNLIPDSSNSLSKGGSEASRDRGDSFGDFASAESLEPPPALKVTSMSLVPSSGHPPPVIPIKSDTSLFGDRYSQVAGDSSDEGRHASEWEKCLTKCYEVMSKANSVFNNISSSSVCSEVIGSSSGIDYLTGVIEVYRVACRITTSIRGLGIDNDILGKLEKDIIRIWNNLSAFLQLSTIKPNEGSFVFKTAMLRPEPRNTPQACGVCLLNVDSRSKAFDQSADIHKLSYGGRQYHATCANLWVNMVDSILPALPLNTLL